MTKDELLNIVRRGESKRVEFKRAIERPERIAEEIVAFANMEGGMILFGVDYDGIVQGLTPFDTARGLRADEEHLINIARNNCNPSLLVEIDEADIDGKYLLILRIPIGQDKPYQVRHNSKYFIRVASTKREATREEQFRLFQASDFLKYDFFPISFTAIDDIDLDKVRNLENIAYRQYSRNRLIMEYLLKLGYVELLGTGIRLMQRRMLEHCGREPEFFERDDKFTVYLPSN